MAEDLRAYIDLTSLNESDSEESIALFCQKAFSPLGEVAALCVYPQFVKQVHQFLQGRAVRLATVINFPNGDQTLEQAENQIRQAIQDGADELDVVFPYQRFLKGEKEAAFSFIKACREACGQQVLKVILETGALKDKALIAEVTKAMVSAGADFIKTSTGKIPVGATLEAAQTILETLKPLNQNVGLKISGGIREPEQALEYLELVKAMMGEGWLNPNHFRIGASQLIDKL